MLLAFALALAVAPTIHNSGFEAAALEGWTVQLPRDKARAAADPSEHRTGSHALLIEAFEPATASVSQTMWVRPGTLWRAAVWTKALPVANGGAIEITTPAGRVATSKAVPGGAWTELSVLFRVPSPGRFAVVLRNTPRNSTAAAGRVWFDDVHLEGVAEPSPDEIRIENKRLEGQISASQGGEFIEQLCHLIPSMIAQQVDGDSFEEEPPWKVTYKRESDKPHRPWYPDGAVQLASYSLDTDRPFNGKRSQRITLPVGGSRAGIAQDGFYFRKGTGYRLRLHMRGNAAVPVWASLRDQDGALTVVSHQKT